MSFMGKLLASIGIGSAKVDTQLNRTQLVPGEKVDGVVRIQGGNIEQSIEGIYLSLYTTYQLKIDDRRLPQQTELGRYRLTQSLVLRPGKSMEIPFAFDLPLDTPLTIGNTKVWVKTGLDIENALDPTDHDYITISPAPVPGAVLNAFGELGFRLRNADCEQAKGIFRNRLPFVQEFEFVPVSGPFRGRFDEVEVVFRPQGTSTEVIMQLDRRAKGIGGMLAEALEMDESLIRFTVTARDIPGMTSFMQSVIARYC